MKCRAQRKQCRRIKSSVREETGQAPPKKFGDVITADHIIIGDDEAAGRHHEKSSLAVLDRGTGGIGNFPTKNHTKQNTIKALQEFVGPTDKVALFYSDGAGELGTAADELGWRHDASTPHRPQTNGVAERNVRRIIEGTRTALNASALSHAWWPEASQCFCNLYNFTIKTRDDCTPYELRHGVSFPGLLIPFGALVSFYPAGPRAKQLAKFEARQVDGIFIGYHMHSGGKWSGDYFVVSREDFTTVANERDIHVQRLKEVTPATVAPGQPVRFAAKLPLFRRPDADDKGLAETPADTTVKLEAHVKSEVKEEPWEEASGNRCVDEPPVVKQEPSEPDTWERRGLRLVRVHKTPRTQLFCPSDVPEDPPPIPIIDIDVLRQTKTNSDMQDETEIEDVWFGRHAHRTLSNPWIGETFFDPIPPPCKPGWTWVAGRLTKIQQTSRPPDIFPEMWTMMSKKQKLRSQEAWKLKASMIERAREERVLENAGGNNSEPLEGVGKPMQYPPPLAAVIPPDFSESYYNTPWNAGGGKPLRTDGSDSIPRLRVLPCAKTPHREKDPGPPSTFAMVAEPVNMSEALRIPKAMEALQLEWDKLENQKCWLLETVREYEDVRDEAISKDLTVHFGHVRPLIFRKHSELEEKFHVYKGRTIFRGDNVRDQDNNHAVFQEMASSASLLGASRLVDYVGMLQNHTCEQSDAPGAFTQTELGGDVATWVFLPRNQWPASWVQAGYKRPVCRLRLALYGHPLSGCFWEQKVCKSLLLEGFKKIPEWECCYYHKELKLVLMVYVDDFKMAGPVENLRKGWAMIRKHITLDDPIASATFLGCEHADVPVDETSDFWRTMFKNMQEHVLPDSAGGNARTTSVPSPPLVGKEWRMQGFVGQCIDRYCELTKTKPESIRLADTPGLDDSQLAHADFETRGALAPHAAKIIMKILWVGRVSRYDIYHAVCMLARDISKWTVACDKRLYRLVGFLKKSKEQVLCGAVGNHVEECYLAAFTDASHADDAHDSKSTTGGVMAIVGPKTFVPLVAICKKQTAVSHSSTEAEMIALETLLRTEALPALAFWQVIYELYASTQTSAPSSSSPKVEKGVGEPMRDVIEHASRPIEKVRLLIMEDNEAVIKIIRKGRTLAFRHVSKTHRVNIDWIYECCLNEEILIRYIDTSKQIADILTKVFPNKKRQQWDDLVGTCGFRISPHREMPSVAPPTCDSEGVGKPTRHHTLSKNP